MKTFVEFRSDKFPAYEGEEEDINPGLWGRRLAEYFVEMLPNHGLQAEEIIAEDWGYYVPVANAEFRLAICCGHQNGDDDQFLCFTDPRIPIGSECLKNIDATEALTRLTNAMQHILSADEEIKEIQWYTPGEYDNPAN